MSLKMQRYEIMPFADLWIGEMIDVEVGGIKLILVNVEDEVRAYWDRCPHRATPLIEGDFDGETIVCPTHWWEFDALTGKGINPADSQLTRFRVIVENETIYVEIPEIAEPEVGKVYD
jgi:toluene monooxygenase system ferredoxin subunit